MGRKSKIKIGDVYGFWEVIETDIEQHGPNRKVLAKCMNCDSPARLVFVNNLMSGSSNSCRYCSGRYLPDQGVGHPRVFKEGVVDGTLTVLRVVPIEEWRGMAHKIERPNYRRTVEARCLCGNTIIRRVEVIKRDPIPTCHHCREHQTLYLKNGHLSADKQMTPDLMDQYASYNNCRWFDLDTTPPTEHQTDGYRAWLKLNKVQDEGDK